MTPQLNFQLSQLLPECHLHTAITEGLFEDDDGVGAHFEAVAFNNHPVKQLAARKVGRSAAMHQPRLTSGRG